MNEQTLRVRLVASLGDFRAGLGAGAAEVKTFGRTVATSTGEASRGFHQMGQAGVVAGGVIVAGFGMAVKAAADFEAAMRNVNTISGESESELAATSDAVLGLSRRLPQSATTLAKGLYDIASSGFQGADGLQILDAAATSASAGLTTTATSAQAITAVLNAYGRSAGDATDISDTLFQTVNLGVVSFEQLASGVGDWIGTAHAAGVSFEEASAGLAAMTLSGVNAAEAGTSLNRVLLSFIAPSDAMSTALQKLGYGSGVAALQTLGLKGTMDALAAAGFDDVESMQALFPEVRGLRGAFALLANEGENFARTSAGITSQSARQGAAQRALEEQSKSLSFQLQVMGNNLTAIGIGIGTGLLPFIKPVVSGVTQLADGFSSLPGPVRTVVAGMAAFVGVSMAAGGASLLLVPRLAAARAALSEMGTAGSLASKGLGLLGKGGVTAGVLLALYEISKQSHEVTADVQAMAAATDRALVDMFEQADHSAGLFDRLKEAINPVDFARDLLHRDPAGIDQHTNDQLETFRQLAEASIGTAQRLRDALAAEGETTTELDAILADVGAGNAQAAADADRTTASADRTTASFDDERTAADQLAAAISEYRQKLDDLYSSNFAVDEATSHLRAQLLDFIDGIRAAQIAGDDYSTSLSAATIEGIRNLDALRGLVQGALDVAAAMQAQHRSQGAISATMAAYRDQLLDAAVAAGFDEKAVRGVVDVLLQVAGIGTVQAGVTVDTSQAEASLRRLLVLFQKVGQFGRDVRARIEVGGGSMFAVPDLGPLTGEGADLPDVLAGRGPAASSARDAASGAASNAADAARAEQERLARDRQAWMDAEERNAQEHAERMRAIEDNQYKAGRMSTEQYRQILVERAQVSIATYGYWSDEAQRLVDQITSIDQGLTDHYMDVARTQYETGELSRERYRQMLEDRLADLEMFSDEWRRVWDEIQQIDDDAAREAQEAADERQRRQQDALDKLTKLLDAEADIRKRMADLEKQHNDRMRDLGRQYNEDQQGILDDRRDQLLGWADISERATVTWGNSVSALAANVRDQIAVFDDWQDALADARARGVSEEVIGLLGLDEGPQALGQLRMFSSATQAEIDALNQAVEDRTAQAGDEVAAEQTQSYSDLAGQLEDLATKYHDEVEKLTEEFLQDQRDLSDELAQLGVEQGRSYGDAIAEGLRSSIPAIRAAAQAAQAAMGGGTGSSSGGADRHYIPLGSHIPSGYHLLWQNSHGLYVGHYDQGGYLPVGWSMAYNGTGRPEPVGHHLVDQRPIVVHSDAPVVEVYVDGVRTIDDRITVKLRERSVDRSIVGSKR